MQPAVVIRVEWAPERLYSPRIHVETLGTSRYKKKSGKRWGRVPFEKVKVENGPSRRIRWRRFRCFVFLLAPLMWRRRRVVRVLLLPRLPEWVRPFLPLVPFVPLRQLCVPC